MRIAIVSDTHLTPRTPAFTGNWAVVAAWIDRAAPNLVVHLGDISADGVGDAEELDAAFTAFAGVGASMRFLPGNHDIGDNPLETGPSSEEPLDPERLTHYRRVFGPDWWAIEAGPWQLVGLNAQLFGTGSDEEEARSPGSTESSGVPRDRSESSCTSPSSATGPTTPRPTSATCPSGPGAGSSPASPRATFAS
jgi:3',5'-cyclic AMP phosphodiesterase CpdA